MLRALMLSILYAEGPYAERYYSEGPNGEALMLRP
jgi:hypothetical protein